MNTFQICNMQLNSATIKSKRNEISERLINLSPNIKGGTFNRLSTADLQLLFNLYDEVFFAQQLRSVFPGQIILSLSSRMTRSAGKTFFPKNLTKIHPHQLKAEIRMSTDFFFQFNEIAGPKTVCGLSAAHALEAFQLVFEHELCHFIEFSLFQKSNCQGSRFKTLARQLFGHSESYHQLPTQKQIAFQKYGFKVGDLVTFQYEQQLLQGLINRIHKRATVMVKDPRGIYADPQGTRYSKYYVPIEQLTLLK